MLNNIKLLESLLKSKGIQNDEIFSVINSINLDLFDLNNFLNDNNYCDKEKVEQIKDILFVQ